ncbi:Na+/H+ antiporter [Nocardioides sp.]|uniref:Na+/H+ antiporter n=1 Tax=Nocardioides sp. TaxID=35761 RepID=UPI002D7E2054|nr:Na+/H+ antiporter [Nocardioides sp.]HET8961795.1 Na+/H+ antiporter [Nocardioides sp.]
MEIAFLLVAIAAGVLAGTALARRVGIPAPLLLIAAGIVVSFVPGVPEVHLEPEVVLLGLLPPLLYAAALQTSLVDFNANRRPILMLSVGLVVFTATGIALLVHALLPGISWSASFAIGAVVAPPDAVAATSIGRRIGLPRRTVTLLEGESLLNDATALVALRTAIAAGLVGVTVLEVALDFLLAAGGGLLLGVATFLVVAWMRKHVTDPVLDSAISLVTPFVAYLLAEELRVSGVIAVVVAGLLLGHKAPVLQTAQSRIADRMNWRTIAFLLENAVFLLIGLQCRWILDGVRDSGTSVSRIALVCAAALVGVVLLRFVWMFIARWTLFRAVAGPWTHTALLAWAGMRGVVTLAAAFVIPATTDYREVLLLVAFTVVAGTLLGQGLTLPWLVRRLGVSGPDPAEDALARATLLEQASRAGLAVLDRGEYDDPHGVADVIRQRIDERNFAAWERLATHAEHLAPSELYAQLRLEMLAAERARILEIRSTGNVPAEVVGEVLSMLDVEESMLGAATQEREALGTSGAARPRSGDECEHLASYPAVETTPDPVCADCVAEQEKWVSLRECLVCGKVACCDSSPRRHAEAHFHDSGHPVIESAEPGEDWRWCYLDHVTG